MGGEFKEGIYQVKVKRGNFPVLSFVCVNCGDSMLLTSMTTIRITSGVWLLSPFSQLGLQELLSLLHVAHH